jgi:acetolactate synthase I/II/III large subunit
MDALRALGALLHGAGVRRVVCASGTDALCGFPPREIERIECPDVGLGTWIADGARRASGGSEIIPVAVRSQADLARSVATIGAGTPLLVIALPEEHRGPGGPRLAVSAWLERFADLRDAATGVRRALDALAGDAAGPIVLEVDPARSGATLYAPGPPAPARTPARTNGAQVHTLARRMLAARLPVILAGPHMRTAAACRALLELAQWGGFPVATTPLGRGAFPEAHPLALGTIGMDAPRLAHRTLGDADLVLAAGIGTCTVGRETVGALARERPVVLVATAGSSRDRAGAEVLVGSPARVLADLLACAKAAAGFAPRPTRGIPERIASQRARWLAAWHAELTSDACPLSPHRVVTECRRALPPDETLLVPEAGAAQDRLALFYPAAAEGYLAPGAAQAPGTALAVALGAKLARPERTCIHLASHLSEPYLRAPLETASRGRLAVITALLAHTAEPVGNLAHTTHVETIHAPRDIAPAFVRGRAIAERGRPVLLRFVTAPQHPVCGPPSCA